MRVRKWVLSEKNNWDEDGLNKIRCDILPIMEYDYQANEEMVRRLAEEAVERGVQIDKYTIGVFYKPDSDMFGWLEKRESGVKPPIELGLKVWLTAEENEIPPEEVGEFTLEHEEVHAVHLFRMENRKALPLGGRLGLAPRESIVTGVLSQEKYLSTKRDRFTPATMVWIDRLHKRNRQRYLAPIEQSAQSEDSAVASFSQRILDEIIKEVNEPEYLEALGIEVVSR